MGALGHLVANPHKATPEKLDRLADAYLAADRKQTGNSWLSARQMNRRRKREIPLGDRAGEVQQVSNAWLGSLPKAHKPHRSKHREAS